MHIHKIRSFSSMSYKKSILHSLGHFNDIFDYFFPPLNCLKKYLRDMVGFLRGKTDASIYSGFHIKKSAAVSAAEKL